VTTRAQKLRKVMPGAADQLVDVLAGRPAAEVDLIVAACRQAARDDRERRDALRRRRRAEARRYGWYDEEQLAARNNAVLSAQGGRAVKGSLDALAWLAASHRHIETLIADGVDALRDRGSSDGEIGRALGITRQSVGERFGRRGARQGSLTPDEPAGPAAGEMT